jgi:hypothetical protein
VVELDDARAQRQDVHEVPDGPGGQQRVRGHVRSSRECAASRAP